MIAGRDATTSPALALWNGREFVVGAPELERTGALQNFSLEKYASLHHRVEDGGCHKRRAQRNSREPLRSGIDVRCGGEWIMRRLTHLRTTLAPQHPERQDPAEHNPQAVGRDNRR